MYRIDAAIKTYSFITLVLTWLTDAVILIDLRHYFCNMKVN
jgi:hypothetical protein